MTIQESPVVLKQRAGKYFETHSYEYVLEHYKPAREGAKWARHNVLLRAVQELRLPETAKILDLGCGPGFLSCDLARMGHTGVGLDASPAMIDICRSEAAAQGLCISQWTFTVGDAEALSFADEQFDIVIAAGLIEYMPTDDKILREISRVLKPDGWVMINVTNRWGYTGLLSPLSLRIRRIPGVLSFASAMRRVLVGDGVDAQKLDFNPRKHSCSKFREAMRRYGMPVKKDTYQGFSVFPAPFCTMLSRFTRPFDIWLNRLDRTFLRRIGDCYIAVGQKEGTPEC
jgi:ubiquinone/menaquinone biosynthesis C-methylase UbiE